MRIFHQKSALKSVAFRYWGIGKTLNSFLKSTNDKSGKSLFKYMIVIHQDYQIIHRAWNDCLRLHYVVE